MKTNREASTSITHLVKIVAEEVLENRILPLIQRIEALEEQAIPTTQQITPPIYQEDRQNYAWSDFEEKAILDSFVAWLETTAKQHGRTTNAISMRLWHLGNQISAATSLRYLAKLLSRTNS